MEKEEKKEKSKGEERKIFNLSSVYFLVVVLFLPFCLFSSLFSSFLNLLLFFPFLRLLALSCTTREPSAGGP